MTPTIASPISSSSARSCATSGPALTDDAVLVLVIGDVETDRGRRIKGGIGLAERVYEEAAAPAGYRVAGLVRDDVAAARKMTKLWGDEAGRATKPTGSSCSARPRPAGDGRSRARTCRSTGPGRRPACGGSEPPFRRADVTPA